MKKFILSIIILCSMNSCATIFCGSKQRITLNSNIDKEATLTIDGRRHEYVRFPYTVKIARGFDETVVNAQCPGYRPVQLIIDKKFNAVSVLNLCDILGWGIDAATGAMMKPEFRYYDLRFEKEPDADTE